MKLTPFSEIPQTNPMIRSRLSISCLPYAIVDISGGLATIVDRDYRGICVVKITAKDASRLRAKSPHYDDRGIWLRRGNIHLTNKAERSAYMEMLYLLASLDLPIVWGIPVVPWAKAGSGHNDDPVGNESVEEAPQ